MVTLCCDGDRPWRTACLGDTVLGDAGMAKDEGYHAAGDSLWLIWEHKVHLETFALHQSCSNTKGWFILNLFIAVL